MDQAINVGLVLGSVDQDGGGVSLAVKGLATGLLDHETIRLSVIGLSGVRGRLDWGRVPVTRLERCGPRSIGFSSEFSSHLSCGGYRLLHVHGLWMYQSLAVMAWASQSKGRYIVSPHGMLDGWALRNSAWKKTLAMRLFESRHLRHATCIHALNHCCPKHAA